MDRKEIKRGKSQRAAARPPASKEPALPPPRRGFWFYLGCGMVFLLGFTALMLVIKNQLRLAGQIILVAALFAGLEYNLENSTSARISHVDEFAALTDLLTFSVVPGFLLFRLAFEHWGVLGLAGLFVIIFAGVLRLSLYKVYNPTQGSTGFIGIPLTVTAAFIALLAQLYSAGSLSPVYRLGFLMAVLGLAFLTVSTLRYPNPTKSPWVLLLLVLAVGAIFYGVPVRVPAIYMLLIGGGVYIVLAPLGAKGKR